MRYFHQGWFCQRFQRRFRFLKQQFLQEDSLPLDNMLSEMIVAKALTDHSCRHAVTRLIAHRISQGLLPCSAETGAYCQARKRLSEKFFSDVVRQTGRALESQVDLQWFWKGRCVYVYDGSSVSMPDTVQNQREDPWPVAQNPDDS